MKKSKNDVEFAEFKKCDKRFCNIGTDLFCVWCKKWFCFWHLKHCVQCEQPVCEDCYLNEFCCLVRPWGKTTEEHLEKFYENKLVHTKEMNAVATLHAKYQKNGSNYCELRVDAMKRSVAFYVESFDKSLALYKTNTCKLLIAKVFPKISKYVENEETRLKFVDFMKNIAESSFWLFANILAYSQDRDELISIFDHEELTRGDRRMLTVIIDMSLRDDGKSLFDCLKNRELLDWSKVELTDGDQYVVQHIEGMMWIESNGIDFENTENHFITFAGHASKEMKEYLASKGGKMIEYLMFCNYVRYGDLEIIYKFKGLKAIQSIDVGKLRFGFEEVKYLKSIVYKFVKEKILSVSRYDYEYYALICFSVLKYEDLNEKEALEGYVSNNDIKACKQMYPFMKEIRKKKIVTVLICMKKIPLSYPLPREIIWNILDYAYSPLKERG